MSEWLRVRKRPVEVRAKRVDRRVAVETREGTVVAEPGDYLMVGVEGELYPCDADVFEATYDVVGEIGAEPDHMDEGCLR